jgi:hypothetical protein
MILYRHTDPRVPFLWETAEQPSARWHESGEGPVQYFADTPDGAWAEFLRHEGITAESELVSVRRAIWAVDLPDGLSVEIPKLPRALLTGGFDTYARCRKEARRLRTRGAIAMRVESAALLPGGATGWKVEGGLRRTAERNGMVFVLFGVRPELEGWMVAFDGRPRRDILSRVRHLL